MCLLLLITACTKPKEPLRLSILGDSHSAYSGHVMPSNNDVFDYEGIGITNVQQMWWKQVIDSTSWVMERNNAFSGSLICNMDVLEYYGRHSFICRMNDLGHPDIIFVQGGTNDVWYEAPFGDYVYSAWTEEQLCSFRPALAYLLHNLKKLHPKAKFYFLLETEPCPGGIQEETRLNLIESVHQITNHYGIHCIDLHNINKTSWHPDLIGQEDIANQVLEVIMTDFNF